MKARQLCKGLPPNFLTFYIGSRMTESQNWVDTEATGSEISDLDPTLGRSVDLDQVA